MPLYDPDWLYSAVIMCCHKWLYKGLNERCRPNTALGRTFRSGLVQPLHFLENPTMMIYDVMLICTKYDKYVPVMISMINYESLFIGMSSFPLRLKPDFIQRAFHLLWESRLLNGGTTNHKQMICSHCKHVNIFL